MVNKIPPSSFAHTKVVSLSWGMNGGIVERALFEGREKERESATASFYGRIY